MLADDNADVRGYLRDLLSPYYVVEGVADGEQAMAAARRTRPDLILSDVMMPRLDGFGLLARIRADEGLRSVPVLLLSARAGEEARIEGFDAGADDYVIKPFSARELLARVGALLELRAHAPNRRRGVQAAHGPVRDAPQGGAAWRFLVDADFRIREVNPTARAAFGEIENLIGGDFDEVVHRVWPQAYADEIVQVVSPHS